MYRDGYYPSSGGGQIYYGRWEPERAPKGIVQIVHGIAEHIQRYEEIATYLNSKGYLVVAEDHMGHGRSVGAKNTQGHLNGGWWNAVADTYCLLQKTKNEFPNVPYVLFGHSMGSFLVRTILQDYPNSGISGCILCGTGWVPDLALKSGIAMTKEVCRRFCPEKPNSALLALMFRGYNRRIEHPRTPYDWLTRDTPTIDAFMADPMCGSAVSASLMQDMLTGILYIQNPVNLSKMNKRLPVHFIAGGDDPVGDYSNGVRKTVDAFRQAGMQKVTCRIYPLCRHEILNEINRKEVFADITRWIQKTVDK